MNEWFAFKPGHNYDGTKRRIRIREKMLQYLCMSRNLDDLRKQILSVDIVIRRTAVLPIKLIFQHKV